MIFLNAIQFTVFIRNFTEFIEHRNLLPIYICHQQLVTHSYYFNNFISVILIYYFYNICMWQRAFLLKISKNELPVIYLPQRRPTGLYLVVTSEFSTVPTLRY